MTYSRRELETQLAAAQAEIQRLKEQLSTAIEARRDALLNQPQDAHGYPSQSFINDVDTADIEALRREVRRLDERLSWAYRHYDDQTTVGLIAAHKIAEQRDKYRARLAQAGLLDS